MVMIKGAGRELTARGLLSDIIKVSKTCKEVLVTV